MSQTAAPTIEVEDLVDPLRHRDRAVEDGQLHGRGRTAADAARPVRLRQDDDAARGRRPGDSRSRASSASAAGPCIDGARGLNVPAEQRGMSMVFQSYAIWPHMTVFDNVAYGLRVRNEKGAALKEKVHHALDLVKMGAYAERNASQLSGGQQQRVALARALRVLADGPSVRRAAVEPRRQAARRDAHRAARAAASPRRHLALRHARSRRSAGDVRPIVVMRSGQIEQGGTPAEIYQLSAHGVRRRFRRLGQPHQRSGRWHCRERRVRELKNTGRRRHPWRDPRPRRRHRGARCRFAPCILR